MINRSNKREQETEEIIDRLQDEVERLTQSNGKYKQAMEINANKVRELQQKLTELNEFRIIIHYIHIIYHLELKIFDI